MDEMKKIADRLREARIKAGFENATDAAAALGVSYQTYAAHENGNRGIVRAAPKYARRYGVSLDWLLGGKGSGPSAASANNNQEGLPEIQKQIDRIAVIGKIAANTWLDVDEMNFDHDDVDYVPSLSGYPTSWQFALRIDGKCLNKIADHNDILVCLNLASASEDAKEGDLVIVERKRFGGQMVERTAKRLKQTSRGPELWPESTDPAHQEPIALYDKPEDVEVQIIGRVLWILRRP